MYSVGIIGCGFIGVLAKDCHARAYKENPDTELLFLADINRKKAQKYADVWEVPFACICEPVDIVSICTPPETHLSVVQWVLSLGGLKAIYLEKPIATTLEDADKIIKLCNLSGTTLQVNHQRRFMNPVMRFSRGLLNTGTHAFDLLQHLFGESTEITPTQITFGKTIVDIEILTTEWPVFELDCCHNKERMLPKGVEHLVQCLKENKQPISTGEDAKRALELCLTFGDLVTQS